MPQHLVLVDANVLLNLAFINRLDLLGALSELEFRSPEEVLTEIVSARRAFRREAETRLGPGRILNTPGLLLLAIRRGLLAIEEADELKLALESKRFRMKFGSFTELI